MAQSSIGTASLQLSTNSTKLDSGLSGAAKKIKSWSSNTNKTLLGALSGFDGSIKSLVPAFGMSVAAIIGTVKSALSSIGEIADQGDMASALGGKEMIPFFTGLAGAATNFGIEANTVYKGLITMSKNAQAALTDPQMATAFSTLGIDAKKFASMGIKEQFNLVSTALMEIKDPAERTRLAIEVLGKAGMEMAKMFAGSREELDQTIKSFAVSAEEMGKVQEADAAMEAATASMGALWRELVIAIAPVVALIAKDLADGLRAIMPIVKALGVVFDVVVGGWIRMWSSLIRQVMEFLGLAKDAKKINGGLGAKPKLEKGIVNEAMVAKDKEKAAKEEEAKKKKEEADRIKAEKEAFANNLPTLEEFYKTAYKIPQQSEKPEIKETKKADIDGEQF